jgi:hypothetical protein
MFIQTYTHRKIQKRKFLDKGVKKKIGHLSLERASWKNFIFHKEINQLMMKMDDETVQEKERFARYVKKVFENE